MAKAKRVRWECPNGLHPAVLGSTRPLADATVRFCLSCSEETGRLVKRVAPALEAKRDRAVARSRAKQSTKRERDREAERRSRVVCCVEPDGSTGEVDVQRTLERMVRLPALKAALRDDGRMWLAARAVEFTLHHGTGAGCSGRAWSGRRVHFTVGRGCPRAQVEELILHELTHYLLPSGVHHGQRFRSTLMAAAREWFPGVRPQWVASAARDARGRAAAVYAMDARIWRQAWRLADGADGNYPDWDEGD